MCLFISADEHWTEKGGVEWWVLTEPTAKKVLLTAGPGRHIYISFQVHRFFVESIFILR